jgi:hypothetical protein
MPVASLLQLAQDLEWLGCELEHYGHLHAQEGFPQSGANWEAFLEKQRGVLITAEKIERELKTAISFNPTALVGMEFPLEAALEAIGVLLTAVEDIRQAAVFAVHELPGKVRTFTRMAETYVQAVGGVAP